MSESSSRRRKQEQHLQPPSHILKEYTTEMLQLRALADRLNVRPFYFDNYVLVQYFQQQYNTNNNGESTNSFKNSASLAFVKLELLKQIRDRRRQILFYLMVIFLFFLAYPAHERSVHFVYPGMRMWRRMTLPLVERFPRLTELYDEKCLMGNPFFQVDLNCDPCTRVQSVLDYSQPQSVSIETEKRLTHELVPFIFKIKQNPIQLDDFYKVYANNNKIFQRDAYRVQSTNSKITNLQELFSQFNQTEEQSESRKSATHNSHNLWRCNRMLPARLLRQLFIRPNEYLPDTGIALERYMAIDAPLASSYTIPTQLECANVFIQQALGTRFIILRPTSECKQKCRTLSIRLPQSFVLSYNWWYWKPISAPDPLADTVSISLIGSYC